MSTVNTVNVKINGVDYEVPKSATVLEAAHLAGVDIPTLCYMKDLNAIGACRMCVTEVKGARGLVAACVYPVADGMEINTNSQRAYNARKLTLELILSHHRMECLTCVRNQNCELQKLAKDYNIQEVRFGDPADMKPQIEDSMIHLVRDNSKCILCRRCVAACSRLQDIGVIGPNDRGFGTHISCAFDRNLDETACVSCGQCITVCPTGALTERDCTKKIWDALADPKKHVVIATAPCVRVILGECFGMPIGSNVQGKMVAAIRRMGFDKVFDLNTAADLTILEEGTEFIKRLGGGENLPLITSCCPGWVKFCEHYFPEFIPNLSSCKSPQQMFGAMMKTYYAAKHGIDPKDIFTVSVIPCTAKKFEMYRDFQEAVPDLSDIDAAITTRELGRMIAHAGIMFTELPDEEFDPAFGIASGAGLIFGATGGVMEAALRTVVETVTGKELESLDFNEVRGTSGIKEATYNLEGRDVKVAVCSGLANARRLLERVKSGKAQYDMIEIMACPGGCVNGGGQAIQPGSARNFNDIRKIRASAIYKQDKGMAMRKSHDNPVVKQMYDEFLGEPGGHKAYDILHTRYNSRSKYPGLHSEHKY